MNTLSWAYVSSDNRWRTYDLIGVAVLNYSNPSFKAEQWNTHAWSGATMGDIVCDGGGRVYCYTMDSVNKPEGLLVYELATPVTYQLTPTQISAIVGTNNIFTDTNGDTSLEYYAGHGAETAQVAEEIAADYTAKVVKTKNGIFANLLKSPLNSVWLICCQKVATAGSGFVGIYSFDGVNLNPCVVYIDGMSASFDSATGTITVKYGGSTTDVYGSAFRLA